MTLKFLCRYEDVFADMDVLEKNGNPVVRKLMEIPAMALEYIQKCEKEDREVQRFDGTIPSDIPADYWSLVDGDEEELKEQAEKESKGLSDSELYAKAKQQGIEEPKERATTTLTYDTLITLLKEKTKSVEDYCLQPGVSCVATHMCSV